MTEEEIIEIIEKELSYFRCCEDDIKFKDAIRGLIDLYNKEKEKKESYKKDLKLLVEEIDIKYISKDKIKEKIKHYEELLQNYIEKHDETNDGIKGRFRRNDKCFKRITIGGITMASMYVYEKHYDKNSDNIDRKIFCTKDDLLKYLTKNIDTIFNAGFHSAEIKLNRVEVWTDDE